MRSLFLCLLFVVVGGVPEGRRPTPSLSVQRPITVGFPFLQPSVSSFAPVSASSGVGQAGASSTFGASMLGEGPATFQTQLVRAQMELGSSMQTLLNQQQVLNAMNETMAKLDFKIAAADAAIAQMRGGYSAVESARATVRISRSALAYNILEAIGSFCCSFTLPLPPPLPPPPGSDK